MQFGKVDKKKMILVVISVIIMGCCMSFLNQTNMGTDAFTTLNLGIAEKVGMSLGTVQAIFNSVLLVMVFFMDKSQIGWGTIANMFLVGYSFDFFTWLNSLWIPQEIYNSMVARVLIMIPSLLLFILMAAIYMAMQLGTAPYDAPSFIISTKLPKVPFRVIRILWDVMVCIIGILFGSKPGIVTLIMAFTLGPVITWVKVNLVDKYFPC